MRLSILGFLAIVMLAFTSCSKSDSKINDGNNDTDLIAAIQTASNKQIITIDELPAPSKTVLSSDYADDYIDKAKLAPELGYEVDMRCERGPRVGEFRQSYFDLNGRHLSADRDDKGDHGGKGDGKGDKGDKYRICFEFVYPVTFIMPDGTEITIDSKDDNDGWGEIKSWYDAHPDVKERPELQFPVDIKYKDGTVKTINNKAGMREARKNCRDKDGKRRCFKLVLPVNYTMPDGSEITVEEREDYLIVRAWYAEHPDVKEKPELQYPVDIEYRDGTVKTINNKEEMRKAREDCRDKDDDDDGDNG